jgi:hypothetical protein
MPFLSFADPFIRMAIALAFMFLAVSIGTSWLVCKLNKIVHQIVDFRAPGYAEIEARTNGSDGNLIRDVLSFYVAAIFGIASDILVAIFWPLLFPLSLEGRSWGEDAIGLAFLVSFIAFAMVGFQLCGRLIRGVNTRKTGHASCC